MPISAPPPSWTSIKNKPNTVSGFGITDMASQTVANASNAPWSGISGKPTTISGFGISDLAAALAALPQYSKSLSSGGYQKLPSGLVIQWGEVYVGNAASDSYGTWTYPTSFPNAVFQVLISLFNTTGGQFDVAAGTTSQGLSSSDFTVQEWAGATQNVTAKFFAIGY